MEHQHIHVFWFRYVDDTFVIWPHAKEKLTEFLNNLSGLHTDIQVTIEQEGHLPFLDTDIYRKTDGSLGPRVYRKPTHTSLYLHQNSHHHPANKRSVLASLIYRAKALCDQDSLFQELEFLTTVFKDNGYSPWQIRRALKPATWTAKTNKKPASNTFIPYTQTTCGRLSRMLAKQHQKCRYATKENLQLSSTCQGCFGI